MYLIASLYERISFQRHHIFQQDRKFQKKCFTNKQPFSTGRSNGRTLKVNIVSFSKFPNFTKGARLVCAAEYCQSASSWCYISVPRDTRKARFVPNLPLLFEQKSLYAEADWEVTANAQDSYSDISMKTAYFYFAFVQWNLQTGTPLPVPCVMACRGSRNIAPSIRNLSSRGTEWSNSRRGRSTIFLSCPTLGSKHSPRHGVLKSLICYLSPGPQSILGCMATNRQYFSRFLIFYHI